MNRYPQGTHIVTPWPELIRREEPPALSGRLSSRMVKIAAYLQPGEFIGWQMQVPKSGLARLEAFGSEAIQAADLEWIAEETAKAEAPGGPEAGEIDSTGWMLYEISLPIRQGQPSRDIGFGAARADSGESTSRAGWPLSFPGQFGELVRALRPRGAFLRYTVGSAGDEERRSCERHVLSTWSGGPVSAGEYTGTPVRARALLALPGSPPVRLRAVVGDAVPGAVLRELGSLSAEGCRRIWDNPLETADALPDIAARILALEPFAGDLPVIGIESCRREARPIPATHRNSAEPGTVKIGKAVGTSGLEQEITLTDADLRRHWQIVGQTGTGKSTLLAKAICEAVAAGKGVTFFDPHGSTIDVILKSIPEKHAGRVRVLRLGDLNNPVPVSMWQSDNPEDAERTINDLNLLFMEIFDPRQNGYLGPRWERWFSVFASAAIALLGKKASFDSIALLSQNRERMQKLADAIRLRSPRLSQTLQAEYLADNGSDWAGFINWCTCKLQRITAVPQLRNTLGAGANALELERAVDTDTVTLIDLASPVIGVHASRIAGTLLLLQLWNSLLARKCRDKTHIVAIDEAHLFQTNPLPQMLAEGRKFGVAMILAHQHCGQLSAEVRDALDANSANFSAFRLSVRDAADGVLKLDSPSLRGDLCRLSAFHALTTISVDGRQTQAFTLGVDKPEFERTAYKTASAIRRRSIARLVEPFRSDRALTAEEILDILDFRAENPLPPLANAKAAVPDYIKRLNAAAQRWNTETEEDEYGKAV